MKITQLLETIEDYRGDYRVLSDKYGPLLYEDIEVYIGSGMFAELVENYSSQYDIKNMLSEAGATLEDFKKDQKKAEEILKNVNQLILDTGLNNMISEENIKAFFGALPYEESSRY